MSKWIELEKGWVFDNPKKEYFPARLRNCIRLAGDVNSGLVLNYIVGWFLKKKDGTSKLKSQKMWNGKRQLVLAKDDKQFEIEVGTTRSQTRTAIKKLVAKGVIETDNRRFYGNHTRHIRLNKSAFAELYEMAREEQYIAEHEDKKRFSEAVLERKNARQIRAEMAMQNDSFAR